MNDLLGPRKKPLDYDELSEMPEAERKKYLLEVAREEAGVALGTYTEKLTAEALGVAIDFADGSGSIHLLVPNPAPTITLYMGNGEDVPLDDDDF